MNKIEYQEKYNNSPKNDYRKVHREYYSQYVNENVKKIMLFYFGQIPIMVTKSHHFSDVPKEKWDKALGKLQADSEVMNLLEKNGDVFNNVIGVSILKEACKQIREDNNL